MRCVPGISAVSRYVVAKLLAAQGERPPCLSLFLKAGERVSGLGGQLARKGAHEALGDSVMQKLGLVVNALSPIIIAATLLPERPPPKLDTIRFLVDQLDLWRTDNTVQVFFGLLLYLVETLTF